MKTFATGFDDFSIKLRYYHVDICRPVSFNFDCRAVVFIDMLWEYMKMFPFHSSHSKLLYSNVDDHPISLFDFLFIFDKTTNRRIVGSHKHCNAYRSPH